MNKKQLGFTIIELIVVIAIIAVLAGIVLVNVTQYANKSKVVRANADANNIARAMELFYAEYGDYPYSRGMKGGTSFFWSSAANGYGEPFLTVDGTNHYLSEFYKSDWVGYNAEYFVPNGYYYVLYYPPLYETSIKCGVVYIYGPNAKNYGRKYVRCDSTYCACNDTQPFRTTPYN